MSQSRIVEVSGKTHSTVSEASRDLESSGLIDVDRSGKSNILELTREGWRTWKKAVGGQRPKREDSGLESGGEVSLHNFSTRFEINNSEQLADGWRERWCQGKVQRYTYDPTNDSYVYFRENWRVRVTGEHVIIRLESDLRGHDPVNLKDRAMLEIFDALEWFEDQAPVDVLRDPVDMRIWVQRQHLALVRDPFCQLVDQYSEVELDDVKIYNEDGTERLWLDNSDNEQHLEGGNAPGQNREFAEDDVMHLKNCLYEWLIDNRGAWSELRDLGEALASDENNLSVDALKQASGTSQINSVVDEHDITSTWQHWTGHVMGWAEDIGKPVRVLDRQHLVDEVEDLIEN